MQATGFVFFELYVEDLAHYREIFEQGLGFAVAEDDGDFVKLKSRFGTVLLNAMADLPEGHPFANYRRAKARGLGVELGVVTDELAACHERTRNVADCTVTDIAHQPWGMSDFRISTKEGYFVRVTTPDPEERAPSV